MGLPVPETSFEKLGPMVPVQKQYTHYFPTAVHGNPKRHCQSRRRDKQRKTSQADDSGFIDQCDTDMEENWMVGYGGGSG